jgi:hypothetical protein
MARNGSGTFSTPNTFVSGNPITASGHNQNFQDVGNELTNSLAADGQTSMTGPIKAANGTVGAPSITFASDQDSGWYRKAADSVALALGGVDRIIYSTATATFAVGLVASLGLIASATSSFTDVVNFTSTSHIQLPSGTTGQRPGTPAESMFRHNSTLHQPEYYNGTTWVQVPSGSLGRGYIDGCIVSNGTDTTNDINVAAGKCRDSTDTVDITVAAMSGKQLDANWAPGASAGMRNSAAGISNTTYHIYAVAKADGTQDIYAHTSTTVATVITALQAETGGASYVYARRIFSIIRSGATILQFKQFGNLVIWLTFKADQSSVSVSSTAQLLTISVPNGVRCLARLQVNSPDADGDFIYISSPEVTDEASSIAGNANVIATSAGTRYVAEIDVLTNEAKQVRAVSNTGASNLNINTKSYWDFRGADA